MRGCITKLVIPLVLLGIFSFVVLPSLVEDQIARRLQESVGAPTKPEVEVSSSFPPEMLLGRIDRVRVSSDQMSLQGVAFYDARANLGASASRCRACWRVASGSRPRAAPWAPRRHRCR